MIRLSKKLFLCLFILICLCGLEGWDRHSFGKDKEKTKSEMRPLSTYDRIQRAADKGEITLKEAVLLKAKLLFAPFLIPEDSQYAPKPNEDRVQEDCMTGFYKEVHKIFPQLNEQERNFLKSLSPDLKAIITQKEMEQK